MCGILGVYNKKRKVNIEIYRSVLNKLSYRGPDNEEFYSENQIFLGHRRLKIIDISDQANQPMYNEDKNIVLIFNGAIYNYKNLFDELKDKHHFVSRSDSEILIHGYEEWGIERLLRKIDGFFAFCLYDKNRNNLFLARDPFGEKPLYYVDNLEHFAFASEMQLFIKEPLGSLEIDPIGLFYYSALHFIPGDLCIAKGIKKLLPGHYLSYSIKERNLTIREYWDLKEKKQRKINFNEAVKEVKRLVTKSIKSRMVADVPTGAFLSGGVDSSIIVSVMAQYQTHLKTFSIGFKDSNLDESPFSKLVSREFNTDHYHYVFDVKELNHYFPKIIQCMDEPCGDQALLPLFLMSEEARKKVTVVVGGEGADEVFAGYPYYKNYLESLDLKTKLKLMVKNFMKPQREKNSFLNEVRQKTASGFPLISNYQDRIKLFNTEFQQLVKEIDYPWSTRIEKKLSNIRNKLRQAQYAEIKSWLVDDLLMKYDKMTMANSLEGRAPFLNRELVEFVFNLPDEYKISKGVYKYILREAFKDILPKEIFLKPKQAFNLPMSNWIKGPLKERIENILNSSLSSEVYLNKDYLRKLYQEHLSGRKDHNRLLYAVLVYFEWFHFHKL